MSEAWGADVIPPPRGVRGNPVEALSAAQHLPYDAIADAASQPNAVADAVLRVVERAAAGELLSDRDANLLLWGLHALAQARETRLFGPLLRLLRRPDSEIEPLLGDAITATLPRMAASLFDGDAAALQAAIADPAIDEFARWSLFGALAFLTFDGRIGRDDAERFIVRFDGERLARAGDASWRGWEDAIGLLGLNHLADRVAAARADARLLTEDGDAETFDRELAAALSNPSDRDRFARHDLGYLDDAAGALDAMLAAQDPEPSAGEPAQNPLRHVGRNDPCPCGSGRKFKKCCLGSQEAA